MGNVMGDSMFTTLLRASKYSSVREFNDYAEQKKIYNKLFYEEVRDCFCSIVHRPHKLLFYTSGMGQDAIRRHHRPCSGFAHFAAWVSGVYALLNLSCLNCSTVAARR